jgi:predicted flavoprotein YhiN
LSAAIRSEIKQHGKATIALDLRPDKSEAELLDRLSAPRGSRSLTKHLQSTLNITGIYLALLYEFIPKAELSNNASLARAIKHIPIELNKARPIDEAISTAGGVCFDQINKNFMLKAQPHVFVAGEMLDWEAPTGGYLLSACFATGHSAGLGVIKELLN